MRLEILDGVRGHLLIMMMLAHLSWQPSMGYLGIIHHAKIIGLFDAEFLVFLSGLLIGMLTVDRYIGAQRLNNFIVKRLVKVYFYYLLSAIPFLLLVLISAPDFSTFIKDGLRAAVEILAVQNGGGYSDILPIYLYCFVFLLIISATFTRFRTVAVLIASFVIYILSLPDFSYGFFSLSGKFMAFDVAAWQFLFAIAFAFGTQYKKIIHSINSLKPSIFLFLVAVTGILVLVQRGWLEYQVLFTVPQTIPDNWPRMQLHPTHVVRILIVCAFFSLILIRKHRATSVLTRPIEWYLHLPILRYTGIYSIQMFVVHVYLLAIFQYVDQDLTQTGKTLLALFLLCIFFALPHGLFYWKQGNRTVFPTRLAPARKKNDKSGL